jgi:hypothetical protein
VPAKTPTGNKQRRPTLTRTHLIVFAAIVAAWLAVTLIGFAVTRITLAHAVRELLAVHFVQGPLGLGEAASILAENSKVAAVVAVPIVVALLTRRLTPASRMFWTFDVLLCAWATFTAALSGVLLGAYGSVQLRAFMPFAPVEVTAWMLLSAVYVCARRRQLAWREMLAGLVLVEVLLAVAALLEALL